MDLPIDHFRLLGVSPTAEPEAILRRLQNRSQSPPDQGFTHEALMQRGALLRRSADLLTDPEERAAYEAALVRLSESHPNETVGLDLPASNEVGGLILLWEANGAHEAFQMARQGLQPPQAPALGSGREADLTLLAALACLDASREEQGQRRYESAAQLLLEGIQLQQRMGKLPDYQKQLEQELEALVPFRILDLLSRDLSDRKSHRQGLDLLKQLVSSRGGLDAGDDSVEAGQLSQADFESFFQQIRRFLTVQEQIDLFSAWSEDGAIEAGFLAVLALTAAGFSRRKPEYLEQARDRLQTLLAADLDPMPLFGSLNLLLGNVREAERHFAAIRDAEVQAWFVQHPGDNLAAQCEYCRAWLERDVLPGYRDVDATGVDLDAWFADRDVQHYVDRLDRQASRQPAPDVANGPWDALPTMDSPNDGDANEPQAAVLEAEPASSSALVSRQGVVRAVVGCAAVALVSLGIIQVWRQRSQTPGPAPASQAEAGSGTSEPDQSARPQASLKSDQANSEAIEPVTAQDPTDQVLQTLIQGWLNGKASILAAQQADLSPVARERLVQRVLNQRAADAAAGVNQKIDATVTSVDVVSRAPNRIAVKAQVAYSDQTVKSSGEVLTKTPPTELTITYVFGRDGTQWRLHDYVPGG